MQRFEINHDSFIQGPLIEEVFSNRIEVPKGVLQAVNDTGKMRKLLSFKRCTGVGVYRP